MKYKKHMKERHKSKLLPIRVEPPQSASASQPSTALASREKVEATSAPEIGISSSGHNEVDDVSRPETESTTESLERQLTIPQILEDTPFIEVAKEQKPFAKPDQEPVVGISPVAVTPPAQSERPAITTSQDQMTSHVANNDSASWVSNEEVFKPTISATHAEEFTALLKQIQVVGASQAEVVAPLTKHVSFSAAITPDLSSIAELTEAVAVSLPIKSKSHLASLLPQQEEMISLSQLTKCNICQGLFTSAEVYNIHKLEAHKIMCKFK